MPKSSARKPAKTYAGLDVSLKETAICIVGEVGKIVRERMVATDPEVIAVARKLAVILHAIWRDGTVFEWQTAEPLAA